MCFFDILRAVHDQSGHKRSKVDTVANERDRHQGFDDFWLVFFFSCWIFGSLDARMDGFVFSIYGNGKSVYV